MILTRRKEELRRELSYKEIEIRQITTAIHSAAGSQSGANQAAQFKLPKPGDEVVRKTADPEKVAKVFGGTAPEFSQEAIAALAAEQKAASG